MNVSLIIPTYNKLPRLKLVIASLENQTYPIDRFEVIIIDDGSSDGTENYFKSCDFPYELRYIRTTNQGRAAARNTGINLAKNETVIFNDDDMIMCPNFISHHVNLQKEKLRIVHGKAVNIPFLKFFEDPTNGIFYSQFKDMDRGNSQLKSMCISEKDILQCFDKTISVHSKITSLEAVIEKILKGGKAQASWISFITNNISIPKEWLIDVGGFDEGFGTRWGGEDFELGYRLCSQGYPYEYNEKAINYHIMHYKANVDNDLDACFKYFYSKHEDTSIIYLLEFLKNKMDKNEFLKKLGVC